MIHSVKGLNKFAIFAEDGEIGKVEDSYFDDEKWTVRYLVVRTGSWLFGREVLLSPIVVDCLDFEHLDIVCTITVDQVKNSPAVETEKPISKQLEQDFGKYFGYPVYWGGAGIWGNAASPAAFIRDHDAEGEGDDKTVRYDHHLRSAREVAGYRIHTTDGEIGHVEDFLLDDEEWVIRYLEIHIPGLKHGKKVILTPNHVREVDWAKAEVMVSIETDRIEKAPQYDPSAPITREYEDALFDYYGDHKYWLH